MRRHKPGGGITETSLPIGTLEELFAYCVARSVQPNLIERLLLAGQDAEGRTRLLSFSFQAVTDHKM